MATKSNKVGCFEGHHLKSFNRFTLCTTEEESQFQFFDNVLPAEFKRIGEGKSNVDVLGVGSGGGPMDARILTLLQSALPDVSISADIVEPSPDLLGNFTALLSKNVHLQKIPFVWHNETAEDYERKVKAKGEMKKFDFIHMVQMLYFVDDYVETIKFYHSLLKENGRLMIIQCKPNSGWDILWKAYGHVLSNRVMPNYISSGAIIPHLKSLGLKYEEHIIPTGCDITDCFTEDNEMGELLLDFLTDQEHFHQSFTPEIRAGILDHLRNKCSAEKDGKIMFNTDNSGIIIYA